MLTGDAHRAFVREEAACPACKAPRGDYCISEVTGGRRLANHADRVTAATGQDLDTVNWNAARGRAKNRSRAVNRAGRPALRKNTPGGW